MESISDMDWLEEAKLILDKRESFEKEKQKNLIINSWQDIQKIMPGIKHVALHMDSMDQPVEAVARYLLRNARDLESIHFMGQRLTWKTVSSFDLSHITELSFSLNGPVTKDKINAPNLKKLIVYGEERLTPIEIYLTPVQHIDFSGMPLLEHLELRYFQQVDPADFKDLPFLKKLILTGSNFTNLNWLSETKYKLETLYVEGNIIDCRGVECHPDLCSLSLTHCCIDDITPIQELEHLKCLDLRYSKISNEAPLKQKEIEKVIITQEDVEAERIHQSLLFILSLAVSQYYNGMKKVKDPNALSKIEKIKYSGLLNRSFEENIQRDIQRLFDVKLKRLNDEKIIGTRMAKEEYIKMFTHVAVRYFPFLNVGELAE